MKLRVTKKNFPHITITISVLLILVTNVITNGILLGLLITTLATSIMYLLFRLFEWIESKLKDE
jgi:hypothetical protein